MGGRGVAIGGGVVGVIVVLLLQLLGGGGGGGVDMTDIFSQIQTGEAASGTVDPADEPLVQEMSDALDDIQGFWATGDGLGARLPGRHARAVHRIASAPAAAATRPPSVGPFYCPGDSKAYIDLSFFKELQNRFDAPGDFARVYVLAHELGHHVQNLLGTSAAGEPAAAGGPVAGQRPLGPARAPGRLLRRASGASSAQDRGLIEPGDIEEGLAAAAAVGDDALGNGDQESWTHGSSESRQRWFEPGFDSATRRLRHLLASRPASSDPVGDARVGLTTDRVRPSVDGYRACRASMSLGRTLCTSPTMPRSATEKIGASASLLMAMMFFEPFMPTMCCVAPEMPAAM